VAFWIVLLGEFLTFPNWLLLSVPCCRQLALPPTSAAEKPPEEATQASTPTTALVREIHDRSRGARDVSLETWQTTRVLVRPSGRTVFGIPSRWALFQLARPNRRAHNPGRDRPLAHGSFLSQPRGHPGRIPPRTGTFGGPRRDQSARVQKAAQREGRWTIRSATSTPTWISFRLAT
jgi:hypothetical protein